jgi:hypothetical protein
MADATDSKSVAKAQVDFLRADCALPVCPPQTLVCNFIEQLRLLLVNTLNMPTKLSA